MNIRCIQQSLSIQFSKLGRLIARQPLYFIISPIILTAFFCTGITRVKCNRDSDNLFTARNGKAFQSKKTVDTLFPINTSSFIDVPRLLHRNQFILIQVTSKNGETLLKERIYQEMKILDEIIQNITVISKGQILKYKDLCGCRFGSCLNNSVFDLMSHSGEISKGKLNIKFPIDLDTFTYYFKSYMLYVGGVKVSENGYLRNFNAARLFYILDTSNVKKLEAITQWQNKVHNIIISAKFESIIVSILSLEGMKEEIKLFSNVLLPLLPAVIFSVSVFSFLTCMTNDWVRSKPWLGPSACISAGLAIASGFGFMFFIGIEYLDFTIASTYVVLSTEIDDAFVLIAAWRKTDTKETVEERMGKTYSEAAVSITITSLTNILSFIVGMSSPFPGVQIFCAYGASSMFFTYIYQITFFGGCMALSGYRESQRLHPLAFKYIPLKGTRNEDVIPHKGEVFMTFFRDTFGQFLRKTSVKAVIIIGFFANLGIGIWGLTMIESGNDFSDVFKHNSSIKRFTDSMYQNFGKYSYPVHIVINQPINYADELIQKSIEDILRKFEDHPHIADSSLRLSWLKYYKLFMNHPAGKFLLRGYNMSDKQDFIDGLRFVFLKLHQAKEFSLDIVFNDNYTDIIASRFLVPITDISNQDDELQLLKDLNDIVDRSPIPITIHSLTFNLLEQAIVIKQMTLQVALISAAIICVIFFMFVPNVTCVFTVSAIIFCIILETAGYLSFWNVNLDMVSVTIFVLSVGFSINYPTHISFAFVMSDNLDSNERISKSLYEVGFPIVQGSISTILGVLILAFLPFYITQSTFKLICLIAIQTAFHAMFVIPVIFSILGHFDKSLSFNRAFPEKLEKRFILISKTGTAV